MEQEIKSAITHIQSSLNTITSVLLGRINQLEEAVKLINTGETTQGGTVVTLPTSAIEAAPPAALVEAAPVSPAVEAAVTSLKTEVATPVAPVEVAAPAVASNLDDEGVPWSPDFHASTKTTVASTIVPNGKAWRLKRGVNKDDAEAYRQQYIGGAAATAPSSTVHTGEPVDNAGSTIPATPAVAPVPAVPSGDAGVVPVGVVPNGSVPPMQTPVSANDGVRKEIIGQIKQLADEFGFQYEDAKTILEEEFKAPQGEAELIFGGLKDSDYPLVLKYFQDLHAAYKALDGMLLEVQGWAGEEHAELVAQHIPDAIKNGVGKAYYQDLGDISAQLTALHASWYDWAKQNGKAS